MAMVIWHIRLDERRRLAPLFIGTGNDPTFRPCNFITAVITLTCNCSVITPPIFFLLLCNNSPAILAAVRNNKRHATWLVFCLFVSLAQTTPAQQAGGTSPSVGSLVLPGGAPSLGTGSRILRRSQITRLRCYQRARS